MHANSLLCRLNVITIFFQKCCRADITGLIANHAFLSSKNIVLRTLANVENLEDAPRVQDSYR